MNLTSGRPTTRPVHSVTRKSISGRDTDETDASFSAELSIRAQRGKNRKSITGRDIVPVER
jgi:hypothetical protein